MGKTVFCTFFAGVTLAFGACSPGQQRQEPPAAKSQDSAASSNGIEPCALLTGDEIESTLGWKVANTIPKSYGATGNCNYESPDPDTLKGIERVTVLIGQGMPDMSSSKAMADWRRKQYEQSSYSDLKAIVEPVDGLGVPAIQNEVAGLVSVEMAVKDKLLSVSVFGSLEQAKALAEKALGRMK